MAEFENLMGLLNKDFVMSHQVAAEMSALAGDLKTKCPGYFKALAIGGSTVTGASVARTMILGIEPKKSMGDIDFGIIYSKQISANDKCSLNCYIVDELQRMGYATCEIVNARNFFLVADHPVSMADKALWYKQYKASVGARIAAERLLMPFGVIFPLSEAKELQNKVVESLTELEKLDPEFKSEVVDEMNRVLKERRKMKDKHLPNSLVRQLIDINRTPSQLQF